MSESECLHQCRILKEDLRARTSRIFERYTEIQDIEPKRAHALATLYDELLQIVEELEKICPTERG